MDPAARQDATPSGSKPAADGARSRTALLGIVVGALALRAVVIGLSGPSAVRFGDAGSYMEAAASLCDAGRYPWASNLPFFRAPGLPLFLAVATACHPHDVPWIKAALSLLDAGSVALAFLLALGLDLGRRAALAAAALVAVHPMLVQSSADVTTEPLATLLIAAWLTAIAWSWRARRGGRLLALVAGVAAGLAALTRPAALLCVPLGVAGVALVRPRGASEAALRAAALGLGAALAVAPWSLAASRAAGGLVLVNDAGGYALWRGMHPDLARATRSGDTATFLRESLRFETETSPRVAADVARREPTLAARERLWVRLAIEDVRRDPGAAAVFLLHKARGYWRPWPDRSVSPTWLVLVGGAIVLPVLAGGLAFLARMWRRRPREALFLAAVLLVPWIAQLPYQVVSRFRVAFSDVLLCVLAAGWISAVRSGRGMPRRRPAPRDRPAS